MVFLTFHFIVPVDVTVLAKAHRVQPFVPAIPRSFVPASFVVAWGAHTLCVMVSFVMSAIYILFFTNLRKFYIFFLLQLSEFVSIIYFSSALCYRFYIFWDNSWIFNCMYWFMSCCCWDGTGDWGIANIVSFIWPNG
jgi:hypothetical protein